jgi:hypothetical protein
MVKHISSVLCERISIDQNTNLVSYLTSIEEITVQGLPFIIPLLAFGSLWHTNEKKDTIQLRLRLVSPDKTDKVLIEPPKVDFSTARYRSNIILNGLKFEQSGTYTFQLELLPDTDKWETVSEIPLDIKVKSPMEEDKKERKELPTPVRKIRIDAPKQKK